MCLHPHSPSVSLFIIPPICQHPLLNHRRDSEGGHPSSLVPCSNFKDTSGSLIVRVDLNKAHWFAWERALSIGMTLYSWHLDLNFFLCFALFVFSHTSSVSLLSACSFYRFSYPYVLVLHHCLLRLTLSTAPHGNCNRNSYLRIRGNILLLRPYSRYRCRLSIFPAVNHAEVQLY